MGEAGYKKLIVWQAANELAKLVYVETKDFSKSELYGITSQLRRSALSVPLNIVEGYARESRKEIKRFLSIALGSLAETEYLIDFSFDLKYLNTESHAKLQNYRKRVGSLLWKFYIKY